MISRRCGTHRRANLRCDCGPTVFNFFFLSFTRQIEGLYKSTETKEYQNKVQTSVRSVQVVRTATRLVHRVAISWDHVGHYVGHYLGHHVGTMFTRSPR